MDLRELYQEVIIDHNRNPKNHHAMENATSEARGFNPLCGDKLTVYLRVIDEKIIEISFEGAGCAISQASASLMTEALQGKTVKEAEDIFHKFHQMLTDDGAPMLLCEKLMVLSGVKAYPARVKCATLAWHTMDAALKKDPVTVVTE